MTPTQARLWLIKASLVAFGSTFIFFVLAPAAGYPLKYPDSINVMKIIIPIFAGQLGAAATFLTGEGAAIEETSNPLLKLLVKGPVIVFAIGMVAILVSFPLSNRGEFSGDGMTPNILSLFVSLLSGILTATTGAISSYLFVVLKRHQRKAP